MSLKKHFNRVQYIDQMVKNKTTGDLDAFAKKNSLSKSTLSEIINEMKGMGFPIKYDRQKKTYYYEELGGVPRCLFVKYGELLSKVEIKDIEGGSTDLCFSEKSIFVPCKKE